MQKLIIDTCFLSALLNRNDTNHDNAVELYNSFDSSVKLIISTNVTMELLVGIKKFAPDRIEGIFAFIEDIFDSVIPIDLDVTQEFADFILKNDIILTPTDFSLLYLADKYEARLITFDKKLQKYAEKLSISS